MHPRVHLRNHAAAFKLLPCAPAAKQNKSQLTLPLCTACPASLQLITVWVGVTSRTKLSQPSAFTWHTDNPVQRLND